MNSNRETLLGFEFSFLGIGLGVVLLGTKQGTKTKVLLKYWQDLLKKMKGASFN